MNRVARPTWRTTFWQDKAAEISDAQIQKWREETDKYNEDINKLAVEHNEKWKQLIVLAKELYGERSKEVSYINAHGPDPCYRLNYDFEKTIEDSKKLAEQNNLKELEKVKQQEYLAKAVLWLKDKGKELGKDYEASNAIQTANDIAFDEKVEEMKKSGGYISFSGDDECVGCEGWDMESYRCSCGNRRVGWASAWNFSFLNSVINAEAN